jgi:glycosyltransferase involved in cell wall biosynthesis
MVLLLSWVCVMENKNYDVVVLITTYNCVEIIDRSLQSILSQTFDSSRIKIVAVDNYSTDGTYEKLLQYVIERRISVNRLKKKYLETRLLQKAIQFLQFYSDYRYFTILNPGDILYPQFLCTCTEMMDKTANYNTKALFCNTDIADDSEIIAKQTPIFSDNCILLKQKHLAQFFIKGTRSKVQCLYRIGAMPGSLVEMPLYVDLTDWFKKAFFPFRYNCIYLKDALACIHKRKYDDKLYDLVLRYSLIVKFKIYRNSFPSDSNSYLDEMLLNKDIYKNLSQLALEYATDAQSNNEVISASKLLLFAELVYEDVVQEHLFLELKDSLSESKPATKEKLKFAVDSCAPPPDSIII